MPLLILLLFFTTTAHAQPWQWEHPYGPEFWEQPNPPQSFPLGSWSRNATVGDFDGDGKDEIVEITVTGFEVWQINDEEEWENFEGIHVFCSPPHENSDCLVAAAAFDFDGDGSDELLTYEAWSWDVIDSVRCWELTATDPWTWTANDELFQSIGFPSPLSYSVFGDFDGDGLLNGAAGIHDLWPDSIAMFEQSANGDWVLDPAFNIVDAWGILLWITADLDSDGDQDFGYLGYGVDCDYSHTIVFENTGGGMDSHYLMPPSLMFAGDFNGDEQAEGIVETETSPIHVQLIPGEGFVQPVVPPHLIPNCPLIIRQGEQIQGYFNTLECYWQCFCDAFASIILYWSPEGWTGGSPSINAGHIWEANSSDINGDGVEDLFTVHLLGIPDANEHIQWRLSNVPQEMFSRFLENPDTAFAYPHIGDVEGDSHGELVVKITSGAPAGLYFYEMTIAGNQISFQDRPDLSEGLPTNVNEFTLGDIDNDGQADLILRDTAWHAYFRRNGHWVTYPGILPNGTGNNINLVDFNSDGNLDIISSDGVFLNMTPSATEIPPSSVVSDFTLSCYPNPFNPETRISFDLPVASRARLDIFDIQGRLVNTLVDDRLTAGSHTATFNGVNLSTGVYFARLEADDNVKTAKLLLLK